MGVKFGGKLTYINRLVTVRLSPYEFRMMPGYLTKQIPNDLKRLAVEFVPYVTPPMIIGYLAYNWGKAAHDKTFRKKPVGEGEE